MRKRNKKQSIKISFKFVSTVVLLIAVTTGGWQLIEAKPETVMPVENVQIKGSFVNLRPDVLRQRVVSVLHGGYFTVDLNVIRNTLLELPWVEEVTVRRQWPLSLRINVLEKKAVAYWGQRSLISDRGELFTPKIINRNAVLPELSGPDDLHNNVVQYYGEVSKKLSLAGFEVNQLSLDGRRAWRMRVSRDGGVRNVDVRLGRAEVSRRLERFIKVFSMNEMRDINNILAIDLRYPNGFAVHRQETNNNNAEAEMASREAEV